jgi:hypothetical protein
MVKLICAVWFALAFSFAAFGAEYEFIDVQDERSSLARFFESFVTVVTAYHVQAMPHEAVHAGVAYTFGTKTKYWTIKPMLESVSYEKEDSERRREDIFFTSMSAPVFSRATADLPRWVFEPTGQGYWSRWTSAFWMMSTTSTWVTLVGTWAAFAKDDTESGWDFNNARQAVSDSKRDQTAFLAGLTALMSADVYFNWDDYKNNFASFGGRKAVVAKKGEVVSWQVAPGAVRVTYDF